MTDLNLEREKWHTYEELVYSSVFNGGTLMYHTYVPNLVYVVGLID